MYTVEPLFYGQILRMECLVPKILPLKMIWKLLRNIQIFINWN